MNCDKEDTNVVNSNVLDLFKKAIIFDTDKKMSFKQVNELAVLVGYIVPECLCTESVYNWLDSKKIDYNKSFYAQWSDVISKSRFELFIDQLKHYSSTYGTEFNGTPYIPNENYMLPETAFTSLTPISPISLESVKDDILNVLYSAIPLKSETSSVLFHLIKSLNIIYDIENVKNKEMRILMYEHLGIIPSDVEECVRYLVYKLTGKSSIVKDKETIKAIKDLHDKKFVKEYINKIGLTKMATVFYRYKYLFLAMKSPETSYTINKLRRLAKKEHIPYTKGFVETLLNGDSISKDLYRKLENISVFKMISLINTIDVRLSYDKTKECDVYKIRNGKAFTKIHNIKNNTPNAQYLKELRNILYLYVVKYIGKNRCKVKMPKDIRLSVPTSEKNFIGDIPFGSYLEVDTSNSVTVGVYWHENDGIRDLDLSGVCTSGEKVGWDGNYNYDGVVYSGDVTSARDGANEYLRFPNPLSDKRYILYTNVYGYKHETSQKEGSFDLFVAKTNLNERVSRDLIDKNKILHRVKLNVAESSRETYIGVLGNNKFIFMDIANGNKRVSGTNKYYSKFINRTIDKVSVSLSLWELLRDAGFVVYNCYTDEDVDIDLSSPSKMDILKLFKKN